MLKNDSIIWVSAISVVYILSGVLLLIRSNTAVISARSTTLIYAFHLGNWLETSFIILLYYKDSFSIDDSDKSLWILHAGMGISHFLGYLPYVLRVYRLYLIFCLESSIDDFIESPLFKRTTQKWLNQVLVVALVFVSFFYAFFTVLLYAGAVDSLYTIDDMRISESPYMWIIIFVRFVEELILALSMYYIRNIHNDFNMQFELLMVSIAYFLTPLSVLFLHVHQEYLWVYVLRNFILLAISSIYPVFLSFSRSVCYQMLTLSNLCSVELLLLHPTSLHAFESFLKSYEPVGLQEIADGPMRFELLLMIDCYFLSKHDKYLEAIRKKVDLIGLKVSLGTEFEPGYLSELKTELLKDLERNYFAKFMKSSFMNDLRKEVYRHDLLQVKIDQTSLQRSGDKIKIDAWEHLLSD